MNCQKWKSEIQKTELSKFEHNISKHTHQRWIIPWRGPLAQWNHFIFLSSLGWRVFLESRYTCSQCQYFGWKHCRIKLPSHDLWAINLTLGTLRSKVEIMYPQIHTEGNSTNSSLKYLKSTKKVQISNLTISFMSTQWETRWPNGQHILGLWIKQ